MKTMKHLIYLCLFILITQEAITQSQTDFTLGFADSIKSTILNEQRPLLIYTPYSNKKIKHSTKETYPVLYVLDGENHFRSVVAIVERLTSSDVCPPMIIIGITNTNRTRDLTPTLSEDNNDGITYSGGGEKFLSFLEKELMPYIESSYPTAPYKIFVGHSLGGLMVMHTLIHHKDLFNAYVPIEAAIWWDDHKILKEAKLILEKTNYKNKTLFLAIANRMEKGIDTTAVQSDTTEKTELIRHNLELIHHIIKNQKNSLRFNYKYYENERHSTVAFIATYDALRFLFDYYEFPRYSNYTTENPYLKTVITDHYNNISQQMGYKVLPNKSLVNTIAYRALNQKQFVLAKELFEINVLNFPEDANLLDSFGDYYNAVGDKKNAITWYQKALSLHQIPETEEKLEKLQIKK
jgi:predicted alpha/beta superfamily hydrolase